jgi:putative DNA primase/helicase
MNKIAPKSSPLENQIVPSAQYQQSDCAVSLDRELFERPLNDSGNAERLIQRFGTEIIYVHNKGWHYWDEKRWKKDTDNAQVTRFAKLVAELVREEASSWSLEELADVIAKQKGLSYAAAQKKAARRIEEHIAWGVSSGNQYKISAMLKVCSSLHRISPDELDTDDYLLCVENGTLELNSEGYEKEGYVVLRGHRRNDKITMLAGAEFDPEATCPKFSGFIATIITDPELACFVQRCIGYMLTGDISEQCFFIFYGDGANGKSTIMEVIAALLGELACTLPTSSIQHNARAAGSATQDLTMLPGIRYARVSESESDMRLSASFVKNLTGGEPITARAVYKDYFTFSPKAKLIIATNNLPTIKGGDYGIWRRIYTIPFNTIILPEERNPYLKQELLEELPGILNWALDGYRMWKDEGSLNPPSSVRQATMDYQADQDPVGEYLNERIERHQNSRISAREMFENYCRWCEDNSLDHLNQTLFGTEAKEKGYSKVKSGIKYYVGVRFRA